MNIKVKKTGDILPVKGINFDYREVITKRSEEKEAEIRANGGHYCSSCDPEYDDVYSFNDIDFIQGIDKNDSFVITVIPIKNKRIKIKEIVHTKYQGDFIRERW